jgi:hypothetical protein
MTATLEDLQTFYYSDCATTLVGEPRSLSLDAIAILEKVGLPRAFGSPGLERVSMLPPGEWGWMASEFRFADFRESVLAEPMSVSIRPDGSVGLGALTPSGISEFGSSLRAFLHCAVLVEEAFVSVLATDYGDWPPHWGEDVVRLLMERLMEVDPAASAPTTIWSFICDHIGPGW